MCDNVANILSGHTPLRAWAHLSEPRAQSSLSYVTRKLGGVKDDVIVIDWPFNLVSLGLPVALESVSGVRDCEACRVLQGHTAWDDAMEDDLFVSEGAIPVPVHPTLDWVVKLSSYPEHHLLEVLDLFNSGRGFDECIAIHIELVDGQWCSASSVSSFLNQFYHHEKNDVVVLANGDENELRRVTDSALNWSIVTSVLSFSYSGSSSIFSLPQAEIAAVSSSQ